MAQSPAHKFGQHLGKILENVVQPELDIFCRQHGLYLDRHGERPGVRQSRKVTWIDKYGNNHDLDFVIEKHGTPTKQGRPLAFIETAWRSYTKHSRNKAQEIQGAVLPTVEKYRWDIPFLGAVLAGKFTTGALDQLVSHGFKVVFMPYVKFAEAFEKNGISIAFDEETPDAWFAKTLEKFTMAGSNFQDAVIRDLRSEYRRQFDDLLVDLARKLKRYIETITVAPIFGHEHQFASTNDALAFILTYDPSFAEGSIRSYQIVVRYSNGDKLEASFYSKDEIGNFLRYAAG